MNIKNDIKKLNVPSKIKNYKIEKELYSVSNSYICLGTNLNIKEKVLIKIYDKEIIQYNYEEILLINNEIFIMKLINHKNCIKLYEIIESPSYIFLICEYSSGIKLSELINRKKKLTEDESLNIYKQIISILIYFHEMNFIHLNINPEDILIDINNNIKICDFKYSTFYITKEKIQCEQFGNKNYMCPELWSDKTCYPEFADVWSSGVLFYFLLMGQLPFKGINNYDLQKKIMGGEFALPLNISKNMQDFFKNIFEPKIEIRYNLEKILNSALFKEKKITKSNLPKGFNILTIKYPIDDRALDIYKSHFDKDIDIEYLKQKLAKNIFDSQTSLYKQIISSFIRKKISTEIDLGSKKYISYITNKKNLFDESTKDNNIKKIIAKFEEIKNKYREEKIKLIKKQNNLLNKLKLLMDKKNITNDIQLNSEAAHKEKNEQIKISKKILNKENNTKIKNDKINNINYNNKNTKRGSMYSILYKEKQKQRQSKLLDNKLNLTINFENKKRMSCGIRTNLKFNVFDNHNLKDMNKLKYSNNKSKRFIVTNSDIIKESNEEERKESNKSSNNSSRNSSKSRFTSKKNETNKKENSKIITSKINKNNKNIKVNSVSIKNDKFHKEKPNSYAQKAHQGTKEDFLSQLGGVKLKKYTPNKYINPDEIKKKPKEDIKNQQSIEYNNKVSVKGVRQMIEENLKKSKNNINNYNSQSKKEIKHKSIYKELQTIKEDKIKNEKINLTQKKEKPKIPQEQITKYSRQRKSLNYTEQYLFKTKGILISLEDLLKERSKDDTHNFKLRTYNNFDNIIEEEIEEIVIPKVIKLNNNLSNEIEELSEIKSEEINIKQKDEEERKGKEKSDKKKKNKEINYEGQESSKKEEEEEKKSIKKEIEEREEKEENMKVKEEEKKEIDKDEIRKKEEAIRKKEEELKKKEEEIRNKEEEIIKKEKEDENKRKEERKKIKEKELILKQEEERIIKELEEEERQRKIKEAEEEKKRIEEEELKRKHLEEIEKKRRAEEEEEKRKKEEERIRKEKEKERLRFEEEEKIRKWKEEKKKQKEEEERLKKEEEEKEKKEEEENSKKRKEQIEKKRKKEQEENKKLLEEYEKRQKEQEDKKLIIESMKKNKEEELRKKREYELKLIRESKSKNKKEENDSVVNSQKNIFNTFNNFFFSDNATKSEKKENKHTKNKKKSRNENQEKLRLFYHYQQNDDKDNQKSYNRSYETLNNKKNNTKILYQPIQNNYNVYILNKRTSEDDLNQDRNSKKSFKKLKIKTEQKHKRKIYSNNIHSIKLKNLELTSPTNAKELMTEIIDSNNIKSNNAFKRVNMGKIFKKIKILRGISNINKKSYEQDIFPILTFSDNNYSPTSKKSTKINKKNLNKFNKEKNNTTNMNDSLASNSSPHYKNEKTEYNKTYQAESKFSKKIQFYNNIPEYDIYNLTKSPKSIIRIRKNSQKPKQQKQKCINENELHIYRGDIDYNNVSLKNVQETIDDLINKYQKEGYDCIKKEKSKFNFVKGDNKYLIEIMRLGNGLLYCNIIKS